MLCYFQVCHWLKTQNDVSSDADSACSVQLSNTDSGRGTEEGDANHSTSKDTSQGTKNTLKYIQYEFFYFTYLYLSKLKQKLVPGSDKIHVHCSFIKNFISFQMNIHITKANQI